MLTDTADRSDAPAARKDSLEPIIEREGRRAHFDQSIQLAPAVHVGAREVIMIEFVRWGTLHPALVHFALGTIPVLVLAYGLGVARRSARWTFVGDVTLWFTAVFAVLAAGFGFVALVVARWPGGLTFYKWLHLALGAAGTLLLVGLAVVRWRMRNRDEPLRWSALGVAASSSAFLLAAAWVGGAVLVFRSGIAVEAAGRGALAWPASVEESGSPGDTQEAMARIRGHWARATTALSQMVVEHPDAELYRVVEAEAAHLDRLGRWLADRDERDSEKPKASSEGPTSYVDELSARAFAQAPHDDDDHEREGNTASMATLGQEFADAAARLGDAARARDLASIAQSYGTLTSSCVGCHTEHRWDTAHEH